MVMCLTEVPVSGIRQLSRIITHPVDNALSPKERNENKEQWEMRRGYSAICIMAILRWKWTLCFHMFKDHYIRFYTLKNICIILKMHIRLLHRAYQVTDISCALFAKMYLYINDPLICPICTYMYASFF